MKIIISQKDKRFRAKSIIFVPFAMFAVYWMVIPFMLLDLSLSLYQHVYFWYLGIPRIKRKDFFVYDRWELSKLSFWQKINCHYCDYINGLTAFAKAVANQTEIYNCAIKHSIKKMGQEHEVDFYEREKFLGK